MSAPAGISIPKPDVVFTDLGLAILGAYLGWRLWTARGAGMLPSTGVVVVGGLASTLVLMLFALPAVYVLAHRARSRGPR